VRFLQPAQVSLALAFRGQATNPASTNTDPTT